MLLNLVVRYMWEHLFKTKTRKLLLTAKITPPVSLFWLILSILYIEKYLSKRKKWNYGILRRVMNYQFSYHLLIFIISLFLSYIYHSNLLSVQYSWRLKFVFICFWSIYTLFVIDKRYIYIYKLKLQLPNTWNVKCNDLYIPTLKKNIAYCPKYRNFT